MKALFEINEVANIMQNNECETALNKNSEQSYNHRMAWKASYYVDPIYKSNTVMQHQNTIDGNLLARDPHIRWNMICQTRRIYLCDECKGKL